MKNQSVLVRVPATVGNLGGARSHAALALDASLNLKATCKGDGRLNIRYFGENGERVARDRTNLIAQAFESALHYRELEFTGGDFEVYSTIPVGFGLGSSAAAVWSGLVAANVIYNLGMDGPALFNLAGIFESGAANLHAAWNGGLASRGKAGLNFDRTRVSQEISLVAVVPKHPSQPSPAPAAPTNGEWDRQSRLAAGLSEYLSRPSPVAPSFGLAAIAGATEEISAIAESLEACGSPSFASFYCGNKSVVGFLTSGMKPEAGFSVQEDLLRRGLARKVWIFKPSNSGAQEWNVATATPAESIELIREVELARATVASA
jgi:hypothetical protein